MSEDDIQAAYAMWRHDMWNKNYGSYIEIDEAVERGELIPGKDYPDKRNAVSEGSARADAPSSETVNGEPR